MAEVPLYTLNLAAADVAVTAPAYHSSAWGGSDAPNANYPEFGQIENLQRREAAGASGQDVLDAINTADYTTTWITMCGIGPLAHGQYDCRGGGPGMPLQLRWKQFLKSSSLAETGFNSLVALTNHGAAGAASGSGLFSIDLFFTIELFQDTGSAFQWNARYATVNGGGGFTTGQVNSGLTSNPGTSDNAEHTMILTYMPSTVTGAYTSSFVVGSAIVASDGSFDLTQDGVSVISGSGLKLVVNPFATTNPELYYGKSIWFGD